jgi:hypothetical protein
VTEQPCDRTDLPDLADMHCACGFEAGEHPAWQRRAQRAKVAREDRLGSTEDQDAEHR